MQNTYALYTAVSQYCNDRCTCPHFSTYLSVEQTAHFISKYVFIEHENRKPFYSFDAHMGHRSNTFAFIDMARIIWDQVQRKENEINSMACRSILLGTLNRMKPCLIDILLRIEYFTMCILPGHKPADTSSMLIYFNWAVDEHCANRPTYTTLENTLFC